MLLPGGGTCDMCCGDVKWPHLSIKTIKQMISMTPANNNYNPSNNIENVHHKIHIDCFDISCDS